MASTCELDPLVPLRGGPTVYASLIVWLTDAEARGINLRIEPDGRLHVWPRAAVDEADLAHIRAHRDAILCLLRYVERTVPC